MALEETLELDVANALRGVDNIDAALVQTTQQFAVNLADALDVLRAPPDVVIDGASVTAQITEAVQAADTTATVIADGLDAVESQVADAITAGTESADTSVTLTAEGLDGIASDLAAAVDAADTTVTVTADTQPAAEEIAGLGASADVTAGSVDRVTTSTRGLDVAAGLAAGELGDLRDALPSESVLGPVAAGLAAVAVAATASFRAAADAEVADRRLAVTFGVLADEVQRVDVGGLSGDLTELATRAGSSDEALKLALSRIAELGRSAGLSDDEVVGFSDDVAALSLRLAVVNPTLGDAGDIADRLTTALARGGRALAPYGLALSAAEINARALAGSSATTAEELTLAEKAAAGAALAVEQLGDNLGADFATGADQTVIAVRSIRQEFDNALETIGQPLLAPVVAEVRAGLPVLVGLAGIFAEVAEDVLPLALSLTEAAVPALQLTADTVEVLSPVLEGLIGVLDAIPDPVLAAVGMFAALRRVTSALEPGLGTLATRLATSVTYGGSLGTSLAGLVTPVGLVTVGIVGLVSAIASHNAHLREERQAIEEVSDAVLRQDTALSELAGTRARQLLDERNQLDDLVRIGLTTADVSRLALSGKAGFQSFLDTLAETGEISRKGADELIRLIGLGHSFSDAYQLAHSAGGLLSDSNVGLVKSFDELQTRLREGAQDALTEAVAVGTLTEAQVLASEASNRNIDGSVNYAKVLGELLPVQAAAITGQEAYTAAVEDTVDPVQEAADALAGLADDGSALATAFRIAGPGLRGVVDQFVAGTLTAEEFATVLANTDLTLEQLEGALSAARAEQDQFVDAFVSGIPRVTGATAELAENPSLDTFLKNIHKQAIDAANFVDNLIALERRGAEALVEILSQRGVAAAGEAAQAAALSDRALAKREANLERDLALDERTAQRAEALGNRVFDATQNSVTRIGAIKPPDLTKPILAALNTAHNAAAQRAAHFEDIGQQAGLAFAGGLAATAPAIQRAAEYAARRARLGVTMELDMRSPSRVLFGLGENAGLALAAGFESTGGAVGASAARVAQRMVLNVPAAVVGGQTGGSASPVAGGVVDQRQINVYEVANDPVATAFAVDAALGQAAAR